MPGEAPYRYLYCIIGGHGGPWASSPVSGATGVYALRHGDLAAVVSDLLEPLAEPTQENAFTHERVVATIMAERTVVPFAFGCIMRPLAVTHLLDDCRAQFHELLAMLAGKIEVGLKVLWKQETFAGELADSQIRAAMRRAQSLSPEKRLGIEAEMGERLQALAEQRRGQYLRILYEPLRRAAVAARLSDPIGPRMILNAAFLIDRSQEESFDALVNQVLTPWIQKLDLRYTGPWPPYHFVTVQVGLAGGEQR